MPPARRTCPNRIFECCVFAVCLQSLCPFSLFKANQVVFDISTPQQQFVSAADVMREIPCIRTLKFFFGLLLVLLLVGAVRIQEADLCWLYFSCLDKRETAETIQIQSVALRHSARGPYNQLKHADHSCRL